MNFTKNQWKHQLTQLIEINFDYREAHLEMSPYQQNRTLQNNGIACAVGVHIFFEEEPHIILIERPSSMRKHAGQVAFPGGKMDKSDSNLIHTALRESEEELGISPDLSIHIGGLNQVYIPVTNYLVHPFVFLHDEKPVFKANDSEVNDIILLPFSKLVDPMLRTSKNITLEQGITLPNVPCFDLAGTIIWGATSLMLNELKMRISSFPPLIV